MIAALVLARHLDRRDQEEHDEEEDRRRWPMRAAVTGGSYSRERARSDERRSSTGRTLEASPSRARPRSTRRRRPRGGPSAVRAPELACTKTRSSRPGLAELADHRLRPRPRPGYGAPVPPSSARTPRSPPMRDREGDEQRRVDVVVRRRARCGRASASPTTRLISPATVSAPWRDDVRVDHQQPDAEQQQREAGPADRQHREAEQRESAARPRRARRAAPRPGGRSRSRSRRSRRGRAAGSGSGRSACSAGCVKKPGLDLVDLRAGGVQRRVLAGSSCGRRSCSAAPAGSARARRSTFICSASSLVEVGRLAHRRRRPRRRCGRGTSAARVSEATASLITLRRRSEPRFCAARVDRRRGADVRRRRHREHVGRLR